MPQDEPYISVRKWIKWGYTRPNNPPQTLHRHPNLPPLSPSPPSPVLPLSRLQWAFAGTSSTTPATPTTPKHTTWTHTIDSKTAESVQDSGSMYPPTLNSVGETVVLETGSMLNEDSGSVEAYEECWVDVPPVAVGGEEKRRGWVLRSIPVDSVASTSSTSVTPEGKGMIIRIGAIIQGVFRSASGEMGVRRWVWSSDSELGRDAKAGKEYEEKEPPWKVVLSIGVLECPIDVKGFATMERTLEVGSRIEGARVGWECVEVMEW
ncbi:hypothetical protein HYFRA_00001560 [Hymenoscyphus fraxineus]|uniref:Protein HRI1 n=1 Tax=Hymenoscyphus fraxineus TaxID=746836 RepID=A0A9N9L8V5_9HELO|nr:hypothetical protein HYFRA_00001560 [Hymenoscyphus fraxineus]